jgi:hypothetical protein
VFEARREQGAKIGERVGNQRIGLGRPRYEARHHFAGIIRVFPGRDMTHPASGLSRRALTLMADASVNSIRHSRLLEFRVERQI